MTTVSVIVPTYNGAELLLRAIDSVASQTYTKQRMELLIVDDGSTDDTAARVDEHIAKSTLNIRYVRQQNAGPAAARNHGLRLARGDAVAFLDADDYWLPRKLDLQLPLLVEPVALVYCDNIFVDVGGNKIENYARRRVQLLQGDVLLALFCDFFLLTSAVLMTQAAIREIGVFNEQLAVGEDYEFLLRLVRRFRVACVAEPLLARCVRADSLSRLDYALDARNDLATLNGFLLSNPDFALRHRASVLRRLARCHFEFGYQLLGKKRRAEAIVQLLKSLRSHATLAATRTLLRALLPGAMQTRS